MTSSQSIGVYFSANDAVYDWTIAFLNSFRMFNPDLRLLLIPFNDECDRLLKLKDIYNFEIYTDSSFTRLEAIGQAFELGHTLTGPFWFRRYAAFWGPCDRFMYLDARQVVLTDLTSIIQALDNYDFDLLHFDCAIDQVYEIGELRREFLKQNKARGFLSGLWAARKDLFSLEAFEELAESALAVREQLNPRNTDQAFINYCCDTTSVCYGHIAEVLGNICTNGWARQSGEVYTESEQYLLWDYGGLDHKKQLILMHWAGYSLTSSIPNRALLHHFLYKDKRHRRSLISRAKSQMSILISWLKARLRSNRFINQTYHRNIGV